MAASRAQRRANTVPAIARLTRSRDFRSAFSEGATNRQQTIIPVLADDTVGYVLDRLNDAGGTAVIVLTAGELLQIATLSPASEARLAVAAEDDLVTEIHEGSRADMFFAYLERVGSMVVRRVAARLVDHGPLKLV